MKAAQVLALAVVAVVGGSCAAASDPQMAPVNPNACGAAAVVEQVPRPASKVDLVLVVDNSATMADKQLLFAAAVPELLQLLGNPRCLDDQTGQPAAAQPASPLDACPAGATREIPPVTDMHVGILSSSLGSFGADGCLDKSPPGCSGTPQSTPNDDHGHLVTRADPCGMTTAPTYQSLGFLAWDPAQKLVPPGQGTLGDSMTSGLAKSAYDIVSGDGELGCGFESQNESWYRFLVDPAPYGSISLVNNSVQTTGVDQALLQQRRDFLRPDSLLVIVNVTDETDVSIKHHDSYPLFAAPEIHLPHARTECTTKGPTDPCCNSCGTPAPPECPPNADDPRCATSYSMADENTSLRAFGLISHKQRYGIEFFYQPSRYVNALTSPTVTDDAGHVVPNPIFTNLDPTRYRGPARDPGLVVYATITGVPWQLIARQKNGVPDLVGGVSALDPTQVGGFKTAKELTLLDPHGNTFWDDIAGDPENYVPAKSPFMQESTVPRTGVDPITGISILPVSTPNGAGNAINDHEHEIEMPADNLEYACIFELPQPKDCSSGASACDCNAQNFLAADDPLCAPNPNDNGRPTLQTHAKVYPGIKHLAIARGMGDQGVVASMCAKQLTDPTAPDYGFRPAIRAIFDRMKQALGGGGRCFPRQLPRDAQGQTSCTVIEARSTGGHCTCDGPARAPVASEHQCLEEAAKSDPRAETDHWDCFCEVTQASGAALTSCQQDAASTANGWCYVDATTNPALVAECPTDERQTLRFVGTGAPQPGASVLVGCD